ncbi:hypothetical protein CFC21_025270 [Triticum aestivum]|uniref:Inhibitor I9 domain-containing protein n=2 Tax=Triticum aestivum TaxID=4565 RepID=A0A3B6CCF3_WHEAT|nr:hypothetical protein CFC21_025270 [Triticum aestivum]
MARPTSQSVAAFTILMLAVATLAIAQAPPPPKRSRQEIHLFEVTVGLAAAATEDDYYHHHYRLLATVVGGIEAARSAMFETAPLRFSAYLTNNQARRLSRVTGVLGVRQRDDPVPTDDDGH